jgi:DNA repair protein RadD
MQTPSLKVCYFSGLHVYTEWICLQHTGFAGKKARDWWRTRTSLTTIPPETVEIALKRFDELKEPKQIKVWLNKKHPEIMGYVFN